MTGQDETLPTVYRGQLSLLNYDVLNNIQQFYFKNQRAERWD